MGLDVGELYAKQLFGPFNRQDFHHIHVFAAAVIAFARQSLRVLVRQHGALRFQHGARNNIFRCDQFDLVVLALFFFLNDLEYFRVYCRQRQHAILQRRVNSFLNGCHLQFLLTRLSNADYRPIYAGWRIPSIISAAISYFPKGGIRYAPWASPRRSRSSSWAMATPVCGAVSPATLILFMVASGMTMPGTSLCRKAAWRAPYSGNTPTSRASFKGSL